MEKEKSTDIQYHTITSLKATRLAMRDEIAFTKAKLYIDLFQSKLKEEKQTKGTDNLFFVWSERIKILVLIYSNTKKAIDWYRKNCQ